MLIEIGYETLLSRSRFSLFKLDEFENNSKNANENENENESENESEFENVGPKFLYSRLFLLMYFSQPEYRPC